MNFNFFKKKKDEDEFIREEEENQFQPYDEDEEPSDTITTEEEEHEKKGRRLKGKVIAGGIAIVALLLGYMMLSNLFAPKQVQEETVEERPNVGSIKLKGPSSYEEMAKYDAEKQRQLEEAKKKEAELLAAQKKEQPPARQVTPPPSTPSVTPPSVPSAPSAPVIDRGEMAANRSSIGFNVGGNANSSVASIYSTATSAPSAHLNMSSGHVIQAGTVVPAVLLMGIDTRMSDMITAQVRQDVYDSLTGRHLLIPQGSRLIGKVGGGNGRRVGVSFERLIMPDGTSMTLPKQNAVDNQGFGGMKDKYDHHDSDFFRGALISAVVGYLSDAVDEHFDRHSTTNNGDAYETAMTKVADNISGRIMERADRTEPANAIIRQGFQFNVLITQDMTAYEYMR